MPPGTHSSAGEAGTAAGTTNHGCPEFDGRGTLHRQLNVADSLKEEIPNEVA